MLLTSSQPPRERDLHHQEDVYYNVLQRPAGSIEHLNVGCPTGFKQSMILAEPLQSEEQGSQHFLYVPISKMERRHFHRLTFNSTHLLHRPSEHRLFGGTQRKKTNKRETQKQKQ